MVVTIRATREQLSVLHRMIRQTATFADVMSITQAATVNSLSIKHALHLGGDRLSVDLVTVQRIEALIQVVTNRQENAVAGYVTVHFRVIYYC